MIKNILKFTLIFLAIFIGMLGFAHVFYKNFLIHQEHFTIKKSGRIIVLNGTSSAGKTATARQLQYLLGKNYLYVSMNHFLDMLSCEICNLNSSTYTFLQSNEGFYASQRDDGTLDITIGPLGKKILHDMCNSTEALLQSGWSVIFTVIEPLKEDVLLLKQRFKKYHPLFVYLYADKDLVAQRDSLRHDRLAGYATNLLDKYTSQDLHDIQIDISKLTQEQIAQKIYEAAC